MSKVTKKRLYAILASLACVLAVLTSTILSVGASVTNSYWLRTPVQGYSTLGFVVNDSQAIVEFPLSPSSFPDGYYEGTTWDSQFYYSNYDVTMSDGSTMNVSSRFEYLQNSDGDIPVPTYRSYDAIWGDFETPITTEVYSYRQTNKAMMGGIDSYRWRDVEMGYPDGYWSTLHYTLGDIYYWDEDTLDTPDTQSIRQLLRIPFSSLGTEELDMGTEDYDYSDLVVFGGSAGGLLDVGTGVMYYGRDVLNVEIRTSEYSRETLVCLDVELPEGDDFKGHLFKLVDFTAEIFVFRGQYNELDDFNVYVETGYNTIENVDEVARSLQGQSKIEMPDYVDIGSWLAKGVSGFFDLQIVPGISLGGILAVFVAFGVTMYLIKLFLGG